MTEITRIHAEWAVVDRLSAMLREPPHTAYNVTQSYGLCLAILAWVLQRVRTPENKAITQEDHASISVKTALDGQRIKDQPWAITTSGSGPRNSDFVGFTAFKFLKWLRDATCHGDARNVAPINMNGALIGFRFEMKEKRDSQVRSLELTESDLRRIGLTLAEMYCDALGRSDSFIEDARSMREESNPA
jgi:hypothetical protein